MAHADVEDGTDMSEVVSETNVNDADIQHKEYHVKLQNSDVLSNLDQKLGHLEEIKQAEISNLVQDFEDIFPDEPKQTNAAHHDVDIGETDPIKQHPYRVNPLKMEHLKREINYMLENDIIEPSNSDWSSRCM